MYFQSLKDGKEYHIADKIDEENSMLVRTDVVIRHELHINRKRDVYNGPPQNRPLSSTIVCHIMQRAFCPYLPSSVITVITR